MSQLPLRLSMLCSRQMIISGVPVRAGLYDLDAGFEGTTAAGISLYHAPTTPEIAHDASAAEVEDLLGTLLSLGLVYCVLEQNGTMVYFI